MPFFSCYSRCVVVSSFCHPSGESIINAPPRPINRSQLITQTGGGGGCGAWTGTIHPALCDITMVAVAGIVSNANTAISFQPYNHPRSPAVFFRDAILHRALTHWHRPPYTSPVAVTVAEEIRFGDDKYQLSRLLLPWVAATTVGLLWLRPLTPHHPSSLYTVQYKSIFCSVWYDT